MSESKNVYDLSRAESGFHELDLEKVKRLALAGHTEKFIIQFFDIPPSTWNNWKKAHPLFAERLKEWKNKSDEEVVQALRGRAVGMKITEQKVNKDGDIIEVEKELPPDVGACSKWLSARQPKEWANKQTVEVEGGDKPVRVEGNVTQEDLDERIKNIVEGRLKDALQ